jgi:hypothetical protein
MTNAIVEMSDRQDRLETHLIELQETIDDEQYKKIASNIGPNIFPADIPAEL